jgi:hypothetical protein
MVESISDDPKIKAESLAWLAVAIAPRDRELAYSVIDRSLAIYLDQADFFRGWNNPDVSGLAARVAIQARDIGYPDLDSVVARVLALRPTIQQDSPARVAEAHVATAMILALADPPAARELLRAAESHAETIGSGLSGIRHHYWLQAWALADLPHAAQLFRKELESVKSRPKASLSERGLIGMLDILTTRPEDRTHRILGEFGTFWFPGEE